ncbi:lipoprotein signal peptidase [Mycoplasmoides fastidiosum]|uniref:Lipoprotein signal peptidase n=1 Tax=Mycoplasmoides fastidiosum TaxID=92758 RepID=A0ABU0LYI1_9BACT|nr:signal peptidase II [Mycoplasmoides fastidiosum]MDQ0513673.1 lipoprotein signal peptidase [Mycoplasmoides fastidiosum]UUD37908.1 signal peptidase II [Mycoplasmoides fastidiosum]
MKKIKRLMTPEFWQETWVQIKEYLHNIYVVNRKKLLLNYALSLIIMTVIFLAAFLLRQNAINATFQPSLNGWIILANRGISFGLLTGSAWVYVLQILPVILTGLALLRNINFFATVGLSLIFSAGLSNVIDRGLPDVFGQFVQGSTAAENGMYIARDAVVDYWQMSASGAVFNFPDVFIIVGIILFFLYSFYNGYIEAKVKMKEEQEREAAVTQAAAEQEHLSKSKNLDQLYKK